MNTVNKPKLTAFVMIFMALLVGGCTVRIAQGDEKTMTMNVESGYAAVNGLEMYYEIHGNASTERPPLVLLHGALATIDMWRGILPSLAETRQVIAVEQQAHGHTADIDRPLSYEQMADDTAALLRQLGVQEADVYGYSMGGNTALQVAIRHPDLVRKLVVASGAYTREGYYPEMFEGIKHMKAEDLAGSPMHESYIRTAPDPEAWPTLVAKVQQQEQAFKGWSPEDVQSITAPTLIIIADSDVVRPEHAVEMFRLLGGGVAGDFTSLPNSQLAVIPGTTHVSLVMERTGWLLAMITDFLDAPMPETH